MTEDLKFRSDTPIQQTAAAFRKKQAWVQVFGVWYFWVCIVRMPVRWCCKCCCCCCCCWWWWWYY